VASWLDGPGEPGWTQYPGRRLGRPEQGSRSVARIGRRLAGLLVDWLLAVLIARWLFHGHPLGPLGVFAVEQLLLVGTLGSSIGHAAVGLRVETVAGRLPGPLRAAVRTALICVVIPAVIWDRDQRGLQDKAAGTVLVRR
jgi:hypothetical protein